MVTTAPESKSAAGEKSDWLEPLLAAWQPGTGAASGGQRAGDRPPSADGSSIDSRRRPPGCCRGCGGAAGVGRAGLPGALGHPAPRGGHLRAAPRRVRRVDAARDRRPSQQDAPRAELHRGRAAGRGGHALAAVRLARAHGPEGAAVDDSPRAGGRRGRDHAVELTKRAGHARRRARARAGQRGHPQARPADSGLRRGDVRGHLPAKPACPTGLLQIVIGDAETGEALVTDPNVNVVSFTGSTEVGRMVGALAGGLLKKVSLELGGNNPLIVLDDADVPAAASAGAYASFQFQGQVCFATGRHIVQRKVVDEYVELLAADGQAAAHRRSVSRGRGARPDRQRAAAQARRRHRQALGRGGRAAGRGRHL